MEENHDLDSKQNQMTDKNIDDDNSKDETQLKNIRTTPTFVTPENSNGIPDRRRASTTTSFLKTEHNSDKG